MKDISIREYIERFDRGDFNTEESQCDAGWYDWFCSDKALVAKTRKLTRKLKQIVFSSKIDIYKNYVFFKNNCPMNGELYDDFRICSLETGDVLYTIVPSSGHISDEGRAELYGYENEFKEPLVTGTWEDIVSFFLPKTNTTQRIK